LPLQYLRRSSECPLSGVRRTSCGDVAKFAVGAAWFYAFAMITFYIAISMIGPAQVSLLSYSEPVTAAGLGVTLLGEALAPIQIAGIALVVMALIGATLWQPRAH